MELTNEFRVGVSYPDAWKVSAKALGQFVDALHDDLAASDAGGSGELEPAEATARLAANGFGPETTAASTEDGAIEISYGLRRIECSDGETVDLLQVADGWSAMECILPLVGMALLIVVRRLQRRASRPRS